MIVTYHLEAARMVAYDEAIGRTAFRYALDAVEQLPPGERRLRIMEAMMAFEAGQHVAVLVRAVRN